MAAKSQSDSADSLISTAKFTLLPKAKSPEIHPLASVFTIAASLVFTCATPNATIYYTTDGSVPTQTSLIVESGSTVLSCFVLFPPNRFILFILLVCSSFSSHSLFFISFFHFLFTDVDINVEVDIPSPTTMLSS